MQPLRYKRALALAASVLMTGTGFAQTNAANYPSKPVTIIVPFTSGGSTDVDTRLWAQKLSQALAKPFLVDFKPGAGTTMGTAYVAKAPSDGYTLLSATTTLSSNPALYQQLPFDTAKDLAPVSLMYTRGFVLLVHPSLPASTWAEYVAYVRSHPGEVNIGTSGAGGITHIGSAWLHSEINGKVTYVHYKGSNPQVLDLIAGRVQAIPSTVFQALPLLKAGKVRVIASLSQARSSLLPDVRTVDEQGLAGFDFSGWGGILAPAGTPAVIVNKLSAELAKIAKSPELLQRGQTDGTVMVGSTPQAFLNMLTAEIFRWKTVVTANGIILEE